MENKEAEELREGLATNIQGEIERLIYKNPKCDFEHSWNCAIEKAAECCNGFGAG